MLDQVLFGRIGAFLQLGCYDFSVVQHGVDESVYIEDEKLHYFWHYPSSTILTSTFSDGYVRCLFSKVVLYILSR